MQGFNMGRYHAPSTLDSSLSSTTLSSTKKPHPLGARARKLPQGILTVRFEMPFAIWCSTCPTSSNSQLIGQGVRFNAEKKKVGNYYSTPVWSFRMKHTSCGGWVEIRTDPKNSEYVVTEGARKRDTGDDLTVAARTGAVIINEKEQQRQDAFQALEGKAAEKLIAKRDNLRVDELRSINERDWHDNDTANRKLRARFRVGRKERERNAESGEKLADKMGLGFDILAENEEDRARAELVDFGAMGEVIDIADDKAAAKPLFKTSAGNDKGVSKATNLQQELSQNTRAAIDPFSARRSTNRALPGVKRRKVHDGSRDNDRLEMIDSAKCSDVATVTTASDTVVSLGLVEYDSE